MNNHTKKFKVTLLALAIALGVMFGTTQQSKAAFYDNYYNYFLHYMNLYHSTGVAQYYWDAIALYDYYLAGYYSDFFGFRYDEFRYKSTEYKGSTTYASYYYDKYTHIGDWEARR